MSTNLAPEVPRVVAAQRAGIVTRFIAFVIDLVVIGISFAIGGQVVEFVMSVLLREPVRLAAAPQVSTIALIVWAFLYWTFTLNASGQTLGMSLLGVRAVAADGGRLDRRHVIVRVLAFPFSFLLLGFGFVLILLRRDRRALHDLIARSCVVYAWDVRTAKSRLLRGRFARGG